MSEEPNEPYRGRLLKPKVAAWWILALIVGIPIIHVALRFALHRP